MNLLIRFLINAIVLYLIAKYVPGFNHTATPWAALIAAVVFGLANALIGPVLRFLSAPLTWITHGAFAFVINYILFILTVWIAPGFHNTGEINPWLANLYGTIIMTIVSTLAQTMSRQETRPST